MIGSLLFRNEENVNRTKLCLRLTVEKDALQTLIDLSCIGNFFAMHDMRFKQKKISL